MATGLLFLLLVARAGATATIDAISSVPAVLEDSGSKTNALTGIGGTNTISITVTSSDTNVVFATVKYTSPSTNGSLILTPFPNGNGSSTITVEVIDGEPSTNSFSFSAVVTAVNDAPLFTLSTNKLVLTEDAAAQSITNFVTSISAGPTNEVSQDFDFSVVVPAAFTNVFSTLPTIDTNGVLAFVLATNKFGTNTLSIVMSDTGGTSNSGVDKKTNTFALNVAAVNDAPTATLVSSTNLLEDAGTVNLSVTLSDPDNTSLTSSVTSSDTNKITASITPASGTNMTRTLTLKTVTNAVGSATVSLKTGDGTLTVTNDIAVTISAVNDAPSFTLSKTKLQLNEDAPAQTITNFLTKLSPGATNESDQTFSFSISVPSGVTNWFSTYPTISTNGTLKFTLAENVFGTNTVTIVMTDDGTNGVTKSTNAFDLLIASVNDKPSFTLSTNRIVISQGAGAQSITSFATFSTGPANESAQKILTNTLTLSTNGFFKAAPKLDLATGKLTFEVLSNAYGFVTAKLSVKDNGGTASGGVDTSDVVPFYIAVTNINQAPVITGLTNIVLLENKATNITFTVTDAENANVAVSAISTNSALIGASVSGTGSKRTLTVKPVANKNGGPSTIKVVADDGSVKTTNSFTVTVTSVISGPSLSGLSNKTINEDAGSTNLTVTVSDLDVDLTNVTVSVQFKDTTLGSGVSTNITPSSRAIVLTLTTNAFGSTQVYVIADDSTTKATNSFLLTVNSVNDAPTFTMSTNKIVLDEDSGAQTISFLSAISVGPTNESKQSITFTVKPAETNYFSKQPAISKDGTLTFTTATNKYGTVALKVWATDSGGTANGGVANSVTNDFSIVINNVTEAPTIKPIGNKTILEDAGVTNIYFTIIDVDTNLASLTVTASHSKTNIITVSTNATWNSSATNFYITVTTLTNASGSDTISIVAADGSLKTTNDFLLTVTSVNDRPTFELTQESVTASKYQTSQTVSNLLTSVDMGAPDETNQTFTVQATVDNKSLFSTQPSITPGGVLTFKTSTNSGTALVSIRIKDSGSTNSGGIPLSDAKTLSIVIPDNPFSDLIGDYNGLFYSTNGVDADQSGFVYFNVNNLGSFKGYMLMAGQSNALSGQFDLSSGASSVSLTNIPAQIDLVLDLTNSTETISGTVTNSGWKTALEAVKSVLGTSDITPDVGDYTLVFAGSTNAAAAPAGDGFAKVTVGQNGLISMQGKLGDGTVISQKVGISKNGEWPLYVPLYNKGTNGSLLTWITFNLTNESSAVEASTVSWIKKSGAAGSTYPSGFEFETSPIASSYFPWDGPGLSEGVVILSGGNLAASITNSVTVGFDSITVDPSATNKLSLAFDPATGLVTGSFVDPTRNATNSIFGILLQQLSVARGYFVGTNQTGSFILK